MSEIACPDEHSGLWDHADASIAPPDAPSRCSQAPFGAVLRSQDAPWAWIANKSRLAMTRLARANKLNSCASFLARPL